jgi:hypothetical protein
MSAFEDLDKISSFRGAFHVACKGYTHTAAFVDGINNILGAQNADNADITILRLKFFLNAYPEKAAAEINALEGDIHLPGTKDGTIKTALVNFTQPMLKVLS